MPYFAWHKCWSSCLERSVWFPRATFAPFAAGDSHTSTVSSDHFVHCWGENDKAQLGDGTFANANVPKAVSAITTAVSAAAGQSHSCAILDDGTVRCWGANGSGQLGNASTADSPNPVLPTNIDATPWIALRAGAADTCSASSNGTVACWGTNTNGQLGIGSTVSRNVPTMVSNMSDAQLVVVGDTHVCALQVGAKASCWGLNNYGQLGDGSTTARTRRLA